MEYEIIRKPFLIMEAMEVLYKHVNGISYHNLLDRRQASSNPDMDETVTRRMVLLQEIMAQVCRDVDASDPKLRKYFARVESDMVHESLCLARYLVSSFFTFQHTGFDESVADICAEWDALQRRGAWFRGFDGTSLLYTCGPGSPGDLFTQIYSLNLPAEFRLKLYDALRHFHQTMRELAELMQPVAQRLDAVLVRAQPIVEEVAVYWMESPIPPLAFLESTQGPQAVQGAGDRLRLGVSLLCTNVLIPHIVPASDDGPGDCFMFIGCCISISSIPQRESNALDEISATLKSVSDRKRLEILRRLAKKRYYGLELAEIMNMDPGNLSRSLTALHKLGFLRQERENLRTYYQVDRAAVQNFLDRLVAVLFD